MYDYKAIVSDDQLTMNFCKNPNFATNEVLNALEGSACVGHIEFNNGTFSAHANDLGKEDDIFLQYKLWLTRPERAVGRQVDLEGKSIDELIDIYEELIIGTYILNKPYEKVVPGDQNGFCKLIDWLRSTDFYVGPGSSIYHDSVPGGLLTHTLRVYNRAMSLITLPEFQKISVASAALVTLVHDWCKIGLYESYAKNVKNEVTGQWEKVAAYRRNQRGIPLGHGATSMFLASKFFRLSSDEALAIRWHNGHFNVCDSEVNEFQLANERVPLVLFTQFADHLSITSYAN